MPKIGMRIIKSAIAVFICFMISYIRGGSGIVFYSLIAAILCMKPYVSNSLKAAFNRIIGTIIGGLFGLIILLFQRQFIMADGEVLNFVIISLCIIPLIYITVIIEKPDIAYITCVVFLSVTVSHAVDINIFSFVMNRMLDTIIGILVSLGVNIIHLPRMRRKKVLFIAELEDTILDDDESFSPYSKVKINRLINEGALISFMTRKTSVAVADIMNGISLKLPVITMNGAAIYDIDSGKYVDYTYMDYGSSRNVMELLYNMGVNPFIHTIVNDTLYIYHKAFKNDFERKYYESMRMFPLKSHIYGEVPEDRNVVGFLVMDKEEAIRKIYDRVMKLSCISMIKADYYCDRLAKGMYCLEIYSRDVSRADAVKALRRMAGADSVAAFAAHECNLRIFGEAEYTYYVGNEYSHLKEIAGYVIEKSGDDVVKNIDRTFHIG